VRSCAMRPKIHLVGLHPDSAELADEAREVFADLERAASGSNLAGECSPAIDVYETDVALFVCCDLPGVDPHAVRIVIKGNALLIAGEKTPRRGRRDSTFHLVERGFGRFARTVRLATPCNTAAAHATLSHGELRITVPKIAERRGRTMRVPITTERTKG